MKDLEYKRSLMNIAVLKKNMGMISDMKISFYTVYNIAKNALDLKKNELN
jgi:hypothetical protein